MKKKDLILIFTIILVIFLEPQIFKENSFNGVNIIDFIYKLLKITSFFIVLKIYMNHKNYSKIFVLNLGMQFCMFVSTLLYKGSISRFIGPSITTITMIMMAEIIINEKILIEVLKKIVIYLRVIFVINILSMVLIDTSIIKFTDVYLLGIDNRFIFTYIPWIFFEAIISYSEQQKLSKEWLIILTMCEITLLYKFSASAMCVMSLYYIPYIFSNKDLTFVKKYPLYLYVAANIFVINFKVPKMFYWLIRILKKDITFSGRTYLWKGVIQNAKNHLLIGSGMKSITKDMEFFYNTTKPHYLEYCKVMHAHNSIMTLLYRGGIITVILYMSILYSTIKKINNSENKMLKSFFIITIIIIMLLSIFDTIDFACLYFIIMIMYEIDRVLHKKEKKIKVLYGLYSLQNGGVEQFIYNYISHFDKEKYELHIISQYPEFKDAEEKFEKIGVKLHKVTAKKENIIKWVTEMSKIFKKEKFDIVHSNMNETSFYIFMISIIYDVKIRIVHYHLVMKKEEIKNYTLFKIKAFITSILSTNKFACGKQVGESCYTNDDYDVIDNAIELERFQYNEKYRKEIRNEHHIKEDDVLIGHIGRFTKQKNHMFFIEIIKNSININSNIKFMFIGEGENEKEFKEKIEENKLGRNVIILKPSQDIYKFYSAFDIFALPSIAEGLPVVSIEAQCSGAKCIFSDKITNELDIVGISQFLKLETKEWVEKIVKTKISKDRKKYYTKMLSSRYNINKNYKKLENKYDTLYYKYYL